MGVYVVVCVGGVSAPLIIPEPYIVDRMLPALTIKHAHFNN